MAQINWRNVDTPTFSSVTESQRLAGNFLNAALGGAKDTFKGFREQMSAEDSALLQARVMSFTDPESLAEAQRSGKLYEGLSMGALTPGAMEFVGGRPATLLGNIRTGVLTEGDRLTNIKTGVQTEGERVKNVGYGLDNIRTGVLTEGDRIKNVGFGLDNTKTSLEIEDATFKLGKTKEYEAARPAAIDLLNRAQALMSTGNPADRAAGIKLITDGSGILAAAGMKEEDSAKLFKDLTDTTKSGIEIDESTYKLGKTKEYESARPAAMDLLNRVKVLMASGKPGDYQAGLKLMDEGGPVLAAAGMKREDYESIYSKLESGAQGGITTLDAADKRAKDLDTEARQQAANSYVDRVIATAPTPEDALKAIQNDPNTTSEQKLLAAKTLAERKDALYGGAPDVERLISDAAPSDTSRSGTTFNRDSAEYLRDTQREAEEAAAASQAISNMASADASLNDMARLSNAINTDATGTQSELDVANALLEKFKADQPGIFMDTDAGDMQAAINAVSTELGIGPNLAAAIIEKNIAANPQAWASGTRSVDYTGVRKTLKKFFGTDNLKDKKQLLAGALARQGEIQSKANILQKVQQLDSQVEKLRQEYYRALDRSKSYTGVDVDRPRMLYEAAAANAAKQKKELAKNKALISSTIGGDIKGVNKSFSDR